MANRPPVHWALCLWSYIVLPLLVLAGCYVYLQRSAATHFGMGQEYEREGNHEQALKEYDLAAKYARTPGQRRAIGAHIADIRKRMCGP